MKSLVALAVFAIMFTVSAFTANAVSVQADLPMSYDLTQSCNLCTPHTFHSSSGGTSGGIVGVNFGFLGLQYETLKVVGPSSLSPRALEVTMYDLAFNFPTPMINFALGVGVGTSKLSQFAVAVTSSSGSMSETFAQIGVPFGGIFDVHVSYRMLSGTNKVDVCGGISTKVTSDLNYWTAGIRVGY